MVFPEIEGCKPVDPSALAEYEREMSEEGVPAIIRAVKRRAALTTERRLIKFVPKPKPIPIQHGKRPVNTEIGRRFSRAEEAKEGEW